MVLSDEVGFFSKHPVQFTSRFPRFLGNLGELGQEGVPVCAAGFALRCVF